jgi:hypothetical protein
MNSKPQRNYEEDFDVDSVGVISLSLKLSELPDEALMLNSKAILIVACDSAALLAESLIEDLSMDLVATIVDDKKSGEVYSSVFSSPAGITIVTRQAAQKGKDFRSNEESKSNLLLLFDLNRYTEEFWHVCFYSQLRQPTMSFITYILTRSGTETGRPSPLLCTWLASVASTQIHYHLRC